MRTRYTRPSMVVWMLLFGFAFFGPSVLYAQQEESIQWSIDFNNVSLSDALSQLSQATGIKILKKEPLQDKTITKSYKDQTIEHIIRDMLRNTNYVSIWSYSERGVDSIDIVVFERNRGGHSGPSSSSARLSTRPPAAPRTPPYSPSARTGRPPSASERPVAPAVPQVPEQETSEEPSEEESEENEATDEEEEEESTSSQTDSNETAETAEEELESETATKPTADNEDSPAAQQNEDGE